MDQENFDLCDFDDLLASSTITAHVVKSAADRGACFQTTRHFPLHTFLSIVAAGQFHLATLLPHILPHSFTRTLPYHSIPPHPRGAFLPVNQTMPHSFT